MNTGLLRPVRLDQPTEGTIATRGAWGVIGTASQGSLRFIANLLVGRIAGPVALGAFQGAISVAFLLSLLWPTSIGSAAAKFLGRSRGAGDHEQTRAIAAHLGRRNLQVTFVLAVIAAAWWYLHDDNAGPVDIVSIALLLLGYCGYAFTRGVQYGVGQVPRGTQWDVVSSGLGLTGMAVLLVLGVRGLALLLPLATSYGIYTLACWPHGASLGRDPLDRVVRREIDTFISLAAVGTVVSAGFLQLSVIVARSTVSARESGLFAAALTLATPASLLAGSLSLVLFPTMAEAWGGGRWEQFRAQTDVATRGLFAVMVAIFGSLALCSRLIVQVLWGSRFADSAVVLPILLLAVCFTTLGVPSVNAVMTAGRRGMVITTAGGIIGLSIGAVVWLVAVSSLGVKGIALGYLCGTCVSFSIAFVLAWRQGGHHWGLLITRTLAVMVLVGLTCAWSAHEQWPAAAQIGATAVFALVWLGLSWSDLQRAIPRRRRVSPA